jgi:hypothetical protein
VIFASLIRSFGCSWSCRQPWAPDSSDLARRRSGAWTVGVRSCRSIGSGLVGYLPVGAPFPARAARRPPRDPGFACVSASCIDSFALPGWLGWVHYRIVGLRGRPSPTRAQACLRRDRRCRVPRDWLWSRPSTPQPFSWMITARPLQGQGPTRRSMISRTGTSAAGVSPRSEHTSCRGAGQVPIPRITSEIPGVARGDDGTTARCVAPGRTVSSRTGVPPRRGRPPEQPHDSVVHPTQPPRHGEGLR